MIAKMARVEILVLRSELDAVTAFLQEQGLVHLEEVPLEREDAPEFLRRVEPAPDKEQALHELDEMRRRLSELSPLLHPKPHPDAVREEAKRLDKEDTHAWTSRIDQWSETLRAQARKRLSSHDHIALLTNYRLVLQHVEPMLKAHKIQLGKTARAFVLKGDVARAVAEIAERLKEQFGPECNFFHEKQNRHTVVGLVTYPESKHEAVGKALSAEGIAPLDAPSQDLQGQSVTEIIDRIGKTIDRLKEEIAEAGRAIESFSKEKGAALVALQKAVDDRLAQLNVVRNYAESAMAGVINGWIPADQVVVLRESLDSKFPGKTLVTTLPEAHVEHNQVPTLLRNNSLFKPFELILSLFRPPVYGSYDPTPLVAISFILFYGFILGDVAYGLAVIGFAMLLRKKLGHYPAVRSASSIGVYMGISAIVFGVLFAEFFGDFLFRVGWVEHPIWMHRSHDAIPLMITGIAFGAIHVPLALGLGIWEGFRHGHTKHAIEKLGLLFGLFAVACFALNFADVGIFGGQGALIAGAVLFIACLALLIKAVGAMASVLVLEVVSLVGNVLSYSRLMALGLASVFIADLANVLASNTPMWVGIPAALVIHLLNIGIGMFSPTLHSLRLNYVEFMPKFFVPEGKYFKPFRKEALQ